jgi:hypothetical protein
MKLQQAIKDAVSIGGDGFELLNFMSLPKTASAKRQVEALAKDEAWVRDHMEMICRRISALSQSIEHDV